MPIDARIPLSALGGQSQPFDVAGTIYRSQAAHAMQAEAQRKAQEAQKQQQIDALAAQYDDPEEYIAAVSRIDPLAARKFGEQYEKHKNEKLEGHKRSLAVRDELMNYRLRTLRAVETPAQYGLWRNGLVQENPDMDNVVPPVEQWSPEINTKLMSMGDTIANTIKNEQSLTQDIIEGKYQRGLARFASTVPSIDVWNAYKEQLRGAVPKSEIAAIDQVFATSPSFAAAQQRLAPLALTAEQQAQGESRAADDARQAAKDVTDLAHQKVMEDISRGQLGVAMGNLRVAQGNLQQRITEANKPKTADGKPSTGAEKKALGFFNRAKNASDELDQVADAITQKGLFGQLWMNNAPNVMQTKEGQAYNAAQRAFTEARLRKDSGAAIPAGEIENDKITYFVQPGDSKETIAQKTRMRAGVLASLGFESGRALGEFYGDDAEGLVGSYQTLSKQPGKAKTATEQTVAGPKVGERRKFGDKIGQWDGKQWVQVQ